MANLLVIRALMNASTLPANVKKMLNCEKKENWRVGAKGRRYDTFFSSPSPFPLFCPGIVTAANEGNYLWGGVEDGVKGRQLGLPLSNSFNLYSYFGYLLIAASLNKISYVSKISLDG